MRKGYTTGFYIYFTSIFYKQTSRLVLIKTLAASKQLPRSIFTVRKESLIYWESFFMKLQWLGSNISSSSLKGSYFNLTEQLNDK